MYFCLTIAIISTLLWLNTLFAAYLNAQNNHYATDEMQKVEIAGARFRIVLVIIMGFFWSSVIYYW